MDPEKYVIPLGCTLQGHPKAGALWEWMIVDILHKEFNFKAMTHEHNFYQGEVKGEIIFICQQVDNFAIAADMVSMADFIISWIDKIVSTRATKALEESTMEWM